MQIQEKSLFGFKYIWTYCKASSAIALLKIKIFAYEKAQLS